ncbi:MAG: hypothetical protein KDK50_01115, partial [Chlamydiia bacterium]|nr:hypothetical protein [Chlamydiia bacterium]
MKKRIILSSCLALALAGCQVPSKYAMRGAGGRTSYNTTIQQTNNEQMLLNLVRLRYCDTPYFLDVSGVTNQFSQRGKLLPSFTIPGFDEKNPFKFGAEYEWQNNPTLSYSPLEGSSFARRLMQPIDLRIIQQILYSGWNANRVFRLAVQNFDSIPNASGTAGPAPECAPEYKEFQEISCLLGFFQRKGELQIGVTQGKIKNNELPICCQSMQISFPAGSEQAERLADLLKGAKTNAGYYYLNLPVGFSKQQQIGILPRSILGCMYYLSLSTQVPEEHLKCGAVMATKTSTGEIFDWNDVLNNIMTIRSSTKYPSNAFTAIRYRDYWFYISNFDVQSKRTFSLLMQLYNLQQTDPSTSGAPIL